MLFSAFSGIEKDKFTLPSALAFSFAKHRLSKHADSPAPLGYKVDSFFKNSAGVEHYNMTCHQDGRFQLEVPFAKEPEV